MVYQDERSKGYGVMQGGETRKYVLDTGEIVVRGYDERGNCHQFGTYSSHGEADEAARRLADKHNREAYFRTGKRY